MKHVSNPLETVWYYVTTCNAYFPYIEHRPNGILLDGRGYCGRVFTAPFEICRPATAEEVRQHFNPEHQPRAMSYCPAVVSCPVLPGVKYIQHPEHPDVAVMVCATCGEPCEHRKGNGCRFLGDDVVG